MAITSASTATREDIRLELQSFADGLLYPALSKLRGQLRDEIVQDIRGFGHRSSTDQRYKSTLGPVEEMEDFSNIVFKDDGEGPQMGSQMSSQALKALDISSGISISPSGFQAEKNTDETMPHQTAFLHNRNSLLVDLLSMETRNTYGSEVAHAPLLDHWSDSGDSDGEEMGHTLSRRSSWIPRKIMMLKDESWTRYIVESPTFDYMICFAVLSNAVEIGCETDWVARHLQQKRPFVFDVFDLLFCATFSAELVLRMYVFGSRDFFVGSDWRKNAFDAFLVAQSVFDESSKLIFSSSMPTQLSALRLLRLLRVTRMLRVLHLVVELRTMVSSIYGSFRALFWAVMLYVMFIFGVGVFFTEFVTDRRRLVENEQLELYFGTLSKTLFTLYAAIAGGMDWANLIDPLTMNVSVLMAPALIGYIAFCTLCLMNVVTGIFLDTAMANANEDQSIYITQSVLAVFNMSEVNEKGEITWDTFRAKLQTKQMQEMFNSINVDIAEAKNLFKLVDTNQSGTVDPRELMEGWLRLRGPAKSLDLATLMFEMDNFFTNVTAKIDDIADNMAMHGLMGGPRSSRVSTTSRGLNGDSWRLGTTSRDLGKQGTASRKSVRPLRRSSVTPLQQLARGTLDEYYTL